MEESALRVAGGGSARQKVRATLLIIAVVALGWLGYRYRDIVALLSLAIVLGAAIRPAVTWLHGRGISRALAVALAYIALMVAPGIPIVLLALNRLLRPRLLGGRWINGLLGLVLAPAVASAVAVVLDRNTRPAPAVAGGMEGTEAPNARLWALRSRLLAYDKGAPNR